MSDPTAFRTLIEHREDVRLDSVDAFEGHLVVSYRSEALPRIQLWPIYADGDYGHPEDLTFDSELMSAGLSGNPNWSSPKLRIGATSFVIPVRIYDIDLATGERTLLREQPVLGDYRPRGVRGAPRLGRRARRGAGADLDHPPHRPAVPGADAALRLRRLRVVRGPTVLHRPAVAAGPRHGVRGRPRARRRRAGQAVVRARQDVGEEEHLHRLHRRGSPSRRHRRHPAGEPRRLRRQRGRTAGRCGRQHGARAVRGHPRAGAVRRRVDHDPRPVAAADRHRVGRVGKPLGRQGRLLLHEVLHALRERRGQGLSRQFSR